MRQIIEFVLALLRRFKTAKGVAQPSAMGKANSLRTYVVQAGDTLGSIAQAQYGDSGKWRNIYDANRNTINNPDLIEPGWKLRIP